MENRCGSFWDSRHDNSTNSIAPAATFYPLKMIAQTVAEIEARLRQSEALDAKTRADLLQLLNTLRHEVSSLAEAQAERAESIAGFARLSTHEATRKSKDPRLFRHALDGFGASVIDLESSHPKLVEIVNRICVTLANLGI